jgi:ribosome-binding protein aMBF1 (putative translation factor)
MPLYMHTLLDQICQKFTIVYMVLTSTERQELYTPYIEIMRDCREQAAISQSDLAVVVNLSSKYVTLVEGGRRLPAVESLLALMAASGVKKSTAEQMLQELMECFIWAE